MDLHYRFWQKKSLFTTTISDYHLLYMDGWKAAKYGMLVIPSSGKWYLAAVK